MNSVDKIGVLNALFMLAPSVARAGEIAMRIQDGLRSGHISNPYRKEADSAFTAALTPADLALEDYLGCEIFRLFPDASFFGEEHDLDRVSKFFKTDSPYLVTLDPVNGTRYFEEYVPAWDIVLTITCNNVIQGALLYVPYRGQMFIAAQGEGAWELRASADGTISERRRLVLSPVESTVQFNTKVATGAERIRKAGYKLVNTQTDYVSGDETWRYPTHGILSGALMGVVKIMANLIDSGAVAMIAHEAGAYTNDVTYVSPARKGGPLVVATTAELFDLLMMVVNE